MLSYTGVQRTLNPPLTLILWYHQNLFRTSGARLSGPDDLSSLIDLLAREVP